jgi:hypothetical protein
MASESPITVVAPSRLRRWRLLFVIAALGLGVGASLIGWYLMQAARTRAELHQLIAELDRDEPGWQIDALESARTVVPDAENNVPAILRAASAMPRLTNPEWIRLDAMLMSLSPQVRLTDEQYKFCIDELETMERAVSELESIARLPRGHCTIAHPGDGVSEQLILANEGGRLQLQPVYLLVLVNSQDGNLAAALRMCMVSLHIAAAIGDEPFIASQSSRARQVRTALEGVERVLAHGQLPEVELRSFQAKLSAESAFDPWPVGLRGERAWQHQALEAASQGSLPMSELRESLRNFHRSPGRIARAREWLDDRLPNNVHEAHI